jgi:hypothetical protein
LRLVVAILGQRVILVRKVPLGRREHKASKAYRARKVQQAHKDLKVPKAHPETRATKATWRKDRRARKGHPVRKVRRETKATRGLPLSAAFNRMKLYPAEPMKRLYRSFARMEEPLREPSAPLRQR